MVTQFIIAACVAVSVTNPTSTPRQEVVEVDAATLRQQLNVTSDGQLRVKNSWGQEIACQLSYDGKLLFEVSVLPFGQAEYTVEQGTPTQTKAFVGGAQYQMRKDDLAWENDRTAYRLYGPAQQRSGDRSYGIDVWTKNTSRLVLDERYDKDRRGNVAEDSLRRIGKDGEAQAVDRATSFHLDHGDGMDAYAVGPTLGCGAPALMKNGQLIMPWCYNDYKILDNGPLRFTAELTYESGPYREHRIISLDKGSYFNRMTVWYDNVTDTLSFCPGIALHGGSPLLERDYVLYADPTDHPQRHQSEIYVGMLFPEGHVQTVRYADHALAIARGYQGQPFTYYFGATWSRSNVSNMAAWQLQAQSQLQALRQPLIVGIGEADRVKGIIRRANAYWQANNPAEVRSFWDNAAYHTGNMEVYKLLGDRQMLDYSIRWAEHNRWQGATEPDPAKWKYKQYGEGHDYVLFGDWQICFQTYIDLYNLSPDERKVARAREVMGYEADSKVNDYWWWADALYMVMPVMTKMYKLTGDTKYLDKLYDNLRYCDDIMLDKETGLYFRDGKYVWPRHQSANGKKDFWARGDGWVLAGLAKVLQDMPANYRHRPFFLKKYKRLAKAVAQLQQPEGYWTRSMMDPEHAPGPETSGTAFFCYGILWGVNNGILPVKDYAPVIQRAWHYLANTALQYDGKVGYVQPIGERAIPGQTVNASSQANFGVGAFLLAACEYYRYLLNLKTFELSRQSGLRRKPKGSV